MIYIYLIHVVEIIVGLYIFDASCRFTMLCIIWKIIYIYWEHCDKMEYNIHVHIIISIIMHEMELIKNLVKVRVMELDYVLPMGILLCFPLHSSGCNNSQNTFHFISSIKIKFLIKIWISFEITKYYTAAEAMANTKIINIHYSTN